MTTRTGEACKQDDRGDGDDSGDNGDGGDKKRRRKKEMSTWQDSRTTTNKERQGYSAVGSWKAEMSDDTFEKIKVAGATCPY